MKNILYSLLGIGVFMAIECQSAIPMTSYSYKLLTGDVLLQSQKEFDFIVMESLKTWQEYPYLYDGTEDAYRSYFATCFATADSAVIIAYDQDQPVGFFTGTSFIDYNKKIYDISITKFVEGGLDPSRFYYFDALVVLPNYREHGIAQYLFTGLEQFAKQRGFTAGCLVCEHHTQHPLKPKEYKELDALFKRAGFKITPITIPVNWLTFQVDGTACDQAHVLTYWIKDF